MASERIAPDALLVQTALVGAVTDIDEDVASPDGSWLTWDSGVNGNTDCRVSCVTPSTGTPTAGAGLQVLRGWVRKNASGGNATTYSLALWESGALVSVLATGTITSLTGELVSGTFDAASLSDPSGAGVEIRLEQTGGGSSGSGGNRRRIEIGALEWVAEVSAGSTLDQDATIAVAESVQDGTVAATASLQQDAVVAVADLVQDGTVAAGAVAIEQDAIVTTTDAVQDGTVGLGGPLIQDATIQVAEFVQDGSVAATATLSQDAAIAVTDVVVDGAVGAGGVSLVQDAAVAVTELVQDGTVGLGVSLPQDATIAVAELVQDGSVQVGGVALSQDVIVTSADVVSDGSIDGGSDPDPPGPDRTVGLHTVAPYTL